MFLFSVCVWAQRSLGSIVEPQSTWAPSLQAGDAPNQKLLSGVADSAQPADLRPLCELFQWAAEDWTSHSAGTFHVSTSPSFEKYYIWIKGKQICAKDFPFYLSTMSHLRCWLKQQGTKTFSSFSLPLLLCAFLHQYPGHRHLVQHDHHSVDAV